MRNVPRRIGARLAATGLSAAVGVALCGAVHPPHGVDQRALMAPDAAPTLRDYRLFVDAPGRRPQADLIPYDLNTPLFSDYALKTRYLYLPPGAKARYRARGVIDLPVGSALIKTFAFPADLRAPNRDVRRIETRLLIHKPDGWTARTYVWNADQTDAVLKVAGSHVPIRVTDLSGRPREIAYVVPNQNQCKECHAVKGALSPIGPKARNLNGAFRYAGGWENQVAHLIRIDRLAGAPAPAVWPRTAVWNDPGEPLADRAGAYLDANCGHCHSRAGFAGNSGLYLDLEEQDAAARGVLKRPVAAGRGSGDLAFDVAPGDPDRSILIYRMASREPGVMMPQIGRSVVHDEGLALVRAYIASLKPDAQTPASAPTPMPNTISTGRLNKK